MNLNSRTALIAAKALVPGMRRRGGGRIVMNTSRVTLGKEARSVYSASKGAMQAMARTWALELARDQITVNCVAPGPIAACAFWKNNPPEAEATRRLMQAIPLQRMGTTEDVANAVSFFLRCQGGFCHRTDAVHLRWRDCGIARSVHGQPAVALLVRSVNCARVPN